MLKVLASASKELLLLKRDRAGLILLFIMPALLVIVITMVQENVMELTGQKKTQMMFLDLDKGTFGSSLRQQLATGHIEIVAWDEKQNKYKDIQMAVAGGDYQVGVIIPEGSSIKIEKEIVAFLNNKKENKSSIAPIPVHVFFDTGIMPGLRSGVTAQIKMALEAVALESMFAHLDRELNILLNTLNVPADFPLFPLAGLSEFTTQSFFTMEGSPSNTGPIESPPYSPVQQNVPAWALFGMFFTALPIAGAILQERKSGIWIRLASLPISYLTLITGKIFAYTCVCLCQFLLIGLIGSFLFPYIGLPPFTIAQKFFPVLVVVFFSSLAACGFGIFLGVVSRTYEQALTLGSTAVVLAAALGGVMVPVYAMPHEMQRLSAVSPLNWGLTAFHDVLVRGYSIFAVLDDLLRLSLFFILTILLAWNLVRIRI